MSLFSLYRADLLLLRVAMSKNLTDRSLLLTIARGSTLLSCELVRLSDVSSTELFIER